MYSGFINYSEATYEAIIKNNSLNNLMDISTYIAANQKNYPKYFLKVKFFINKLNFFYR